MPMKIEAFALKTIWASALRDLPFRKASFFVTSLIAPGVFWVLGAALAGFVKPISLVGLGGLAALAILGIGSSLLQMQWNSRGKTGRPSSRTVISFHQAYYSCMVLILSFYCLILALQFALRVMVPFHSGLIVLYSLSALAGVFWAPHSMPSKTQDVALAASREARWLPWVIGIQSAAISLGVFLGVWFSRGGGTWAYFLVLGLSALFALIMVTLGISLFYRFLVFAFIPPPAEALNESGVKAR